MQLQLVSLVVAACSQACIWASGILLTWLYITHAPLGSSPAPWEGCFDASGRVKTKFVVVKT